MQRTIKYSIVVVAAMTLGIFLSPASAANVVSDPTIRAAGNESLCAGVPSYATEAQVPNLEIAKTLRLSGYVNATAWSPDSHLLATSENFNKTIEIWDISTGKLIRYIEKQPANTTRILFSGDGKFLITSPVAPLDAADSTALAIINVATGEVVRAVDGPFGPSQHTLVNQPRDFALSVDGRRLYVTFGRDSGIYVYDTKSWLKIGSIPDFGFVMRAGPANDELTTMDPTGSVRIWNVGSGSVIKSLAVARNSYSIDLAPKACLMASGAGPDGRELNRATGTLDSNFDPRPVRLWDLNSGKMLDAGPATQLIRGIGFNPDGTLLAAATGDNKAMIFKVGNIKAPKVLTQFSRNALNAMFSPDGRYLAVAGDAQILIYTAH